MDQFEIWTEGYAATGEHGLATFHGVFSGKTFDDAVEMYLKREEESGFKDIMQHYKKTEKFVECAVSPEHPLGRKLTTVHYVWACRLFDNEKDARYSWG